MSINSETSDIALDKIKNILISFEKKKRNLEKRKNKLDEYKKKINLNEDQKAAVAKYPEVMSNLELLEELTIYTVQQQKDAERSIKKIKKQEKIDRKRSETNLIEFILKNYSVLKRIGTNKRLRVKILKEDLASENEIDIILNLFSKINISEKGDWKLSAEHMYSLYDIENTTIILDGMTPEERKNHFEILLSSINKLAKLDSLWIDDIEECISHPLCQVKDIDTPIVKEVIQCEQVPVVEEQVVEQQPISPCTNPSSDNAKLSLIFLHDSTVHDETPKTIPENECNRLIHESEARSVSQATVDNLNSTWQTENERVEDVFSSATHSEFMHLGNVKNAWTRGTRAPASNRFRNRTNESASFTSSESHINDTNFKRTNRGGFTPNTRSAGPTRGRGRGWGRHDNEEISDDLPPH